LRFLCIEEKPDGTLKTSLTGECFREAVKTLLMLIPPGRVTSYSKIAEILRAHPRSIARILKNNKEPLIIPCHRVIHKNGELGGYTIKGRSLPDLKKKLLILEGIKIDNRVLKQFFVNNLL